MTSLNFSRLGAASLLLTALLAGCATTGSAINDANKLLSQRSAAQEPPATNLSMYANSLDCFGGMLDIYKNGDPVVYFQTRNITDATNLSHPLAGAEIPGDITEMVRTAISRLGTRVVYVPYHPDYLIAQAQLGAKFGVTMPNYLITGALTEFDRALSGAGRSNSASLDFGKGRGATSTGADLKRTAILSSLALDLNLVDFRTQQMVPRVFAANAMRVLNLSAEDNASLGFYGASFGFKTESKYLQGRHSAIRTLVDLSVLELVGKATNTPYWRCIAHSKPDPVVIQNIRSAFERMAPKVKISLMQVMLQKYGNPIQVTKVMDEPTRKAIRATYAQRFPQFGKTAPDMMTWQAFEPLFMNVPVPGTLDVTATRGVAQSVQSAKMPAKMPAKVGV
jgi:hypothetical protein